MNMPGKNTAQRVVTYSIDPGKNTFHLIDLDRHGSIVMQSSLSYSPEIGQ